MGIHDEETVYRQVADAPGMAAMQLVLPNGRALAGADAMRELLRGIPRWRQLTALFDVPGMRPLGRVMYASIARTRMKISCAIRPT